MLVPSSSEATPTGALDPCSRWGDFLSSPGDRVLGPGRLVKMWLVDRELGRDPQAISSPTPKLYSSLVFWVPRRLSVALEPPTSVLLGT